MANTIVDFLHTQWAEDAKINKTDPDLELLKIPQLHAKYLRLMTEANMSAARAEHTFDALRRAKSDYYNGRMTPDELKAKNLPQFKFILKGEVWEYINGDPDIIQAKEKMLLFKEASKVCEGILKELHSRTYQLRSYMEWQRFLNGQ